MPYRRHLVSQAWSAIDAMCYMAGVYGIIAIDKGNSLQALRSLV